MGSRADIEHLTVRQVGEIRRAMAHAEEQCDLGYEPLSKALFSAVARYGVSPGTVAKVVDTGPSYR